MGNSTGEYQWPAQKAGVAANYFCLPFRVRKRATPTMIYYAPAAANNFMYDISVASAMNPTANYDVTETRAVINATGAGGTAVGDYCCVHWTADADL